MESVLSRGRHRHRRDFIAASASGRHAAWALALVVVATGWFIFLRPTVWGGETGYVVVRGESMLPALQPGELVVTRASPTYEVGDVVAFEVPTGELGSGSVVIHRIEAGNEADGFVLRGDNNSTRDEWTPRSADILGLASFSVPHLGKGLAILQSPLALASLASGGLLAALMVPGPNSTSLPLTRGKHEVNRPIRGARDRLKGAGGDHSPVS